MNEQEFQARWSRFWKVAVAVAMGLALVANALAGVQFFTPETEPEIIARSYSTDCYMEQGGSKFVAASGCEIEVRSGATFDLQSGSTPDFSGGVNLGGAALTWDPAGNTTSQAAANNYITTTIGAATGKFSVLTGNLTIGNGTPSNALNGEDFYVEGGLEADGAARFDGAGDFNSTVDIAGNLTSATGALTIADTLQVTGAGDFDSTLNVDNSINAQADVDVGTWLNLSAQAAISLTEGAIITPTGSLQPLTSAAAVTTSTTTPIAATGEAGDLLILRNDNASDVITIDGTGGTVECKADIALGAKDTVTLILNGSAWHCLANYDNS